MLNLTKNKKIIKLSTTVKFRVYKSGKTRRAA